MGRRSGPLKAPRKTFQGGAVWMLTSFVDTRFAYARARSLCPDTEGFTEASTSRLATRDREWGSGETLRRLGK